MVPNLGLEITLLPLLHVLPLGAAMDVFLVEIALGHGQRGGNVL